MADTPTTTSLLIFETTFRSDIVQQINRRAVGLRFLKVTPAETSIPTWPISKDGAIAENYAEGADASNFGGDEDVQAVLPWGRARSNFRISGTAQRVGRVVQTPAANRNQIQRKTVEGAGKLASFLNAQLYTGTGSSNQLAGLDVAIGTDDNTYAAIDRSTAAYWRPKVVDPGSPTKVTLDQVRSDITGIYEASGLTPNLALCKPRIFDKLAAMFDPTRRYMMDIASGGNGPVRLDGSARAIDIEGCVFVRDKDATANRIYYLNTDYIDLCVLPPPPEFMDFIESNGIQANDGFGVIPMGFELHNLAKNGDSDKFEMVTELQLRVFKPHAFGVRKNVLVD